MYFEQCYLLFSLFTELLILFQALSVVSDYYCYGRWTSSVFNLLQYNVLGGGESHLYGTEGPTFYLKNAFNNFNFCFVLALLFLALLLLPKTRKRYTPHLLIVVAPVYIWLAFMSLQSHKEERSEILLLICILRSFIIACHSCTQLFRQSLFFFSLSGEIIWFRVISEIFCYIENHLCCLLNSVSF